MLELLLNIVMFIFSVLYVCIWVSLVVRCDDYLVFDIKPRTKKFINIFYIIWIAAHICIFLYAAVNHWV